MKKGRSTSIAIVSILISVFVVFGVALAQNLGFVLKIVESKIVPLQNPYEAAAIIETKVLVPEYIGSKGLSFRAASRTNRVAENRYQLFFDLRAGNMINPRGFMKPGCEKNGTCNQTVTIRVAAVNRELDLDVPTENPEITVNAMTKKAWETFVKENFYYALCAPITIEFVDNRTRMNVSAYFSYSFSPDWARIWRAQEAKSGIKLNEAGRSEVRRQAYGEFYGSLASGETWGGGFSVVLPSYGSLRFSARQHGYNFKETTVRLQGTGVRYLAQLDKTAMKIMIVRQ
ncbi:MAG: hypothetical protein P9L99_17730 [Candidatus Lernaella stagnicola]|nr:hypothetical protein [Candidatus Lernaella stagnicola]